MNSLSKLISCSVLFFISLTYISFLTYNSIFQSSAGVPAEVEQSPWLYFFVLCYVAIFPMFLIANILFGDYDDIKGQKDLLLHQSKSLTPLASALERRTAIVMDSLGINYSTQVRFENCRYKLPLPFDFGFFYEGDQYLVECDGEQHFAPIDKWGGEEAFEQVKLRDSIKTKYCADNNIILIRIPYTMKNSSEMIENEILKSLNGARKILNHE